jgi:hypothetical protein
MADALDLTRQAPRVGGLGFPQIPDHGYGP